MNTKSLGIQILEHICTDHLTVPILARALGMGLADFESKVLRDSNPPNNEMVKNLAELTNHTLAFKSSQVTEDQLWKWITDYDVADRSIRVTVNTGTWKEPPVTVPLPWMLPSQGAANAARPSRVEWVLEHPAFTLEACKQAHPGISEGDLTLDLRALRWHPMQEMVNGDVLMVWRWNPLKLPRPPGRPTTSIFQQEPDVDMAPHFLRVRQNQVKAILDNRLAAGQTSVSVQDIAREHLRYEVKSERTLQAMRNTMTQVGWAYNKYDKVWRPV